MIYLPQIDKKATWETKPKKWNFENEEILKIEAEKETDLFNDPNRTIKKNNSSKLLFNTKEDDFIFRSKVKVDFKDTFDAGVLMLYNNEDYWAKLCFEFSPQKKPTIVSVVNNKLSDDCNSTIIKGNEVYLRISKMGNAFAFHYSIDKDHWHMIRYFSLEKIEDLKIGFSVQSPVGNGCIASFSHIDFLKKKLSDIRNGS